MGSCCSAKNTSTTDKKLYYKIIDTIEKDAAKKLKLMISALSGDDNSLVLSNIIIRMNSLNLTPVGYALYIGSSDTFTVLFESENFESLRQQFKPLVKGPLDIVCEMGYTSILKQLLPRYLQNREQLLEHILVEQNSEDNLEPKEHNRRPPHTSTLTPIQRACEHGKIEVLKFLVSYFATESPPYEFDVHYVDEISDENCALISCKVGSLELVRFLHEQCHADFHRLNKRREGAMQLCAAWSKKKKNKKFLGCVKYLVETVKINFINEYEEALIVLEDQGIIKYLEEKLRTEGIATDKQEIDQKYSLSRNRAPHHPVDLRLEERLNRVRGTHFNFSELFKEELEELEESQMSLSSISPHQSPSQLLSDFSQIEIYKRIQ